jgi:hypothetical protein
MRFSVVVPCCNESAFIAETINSLRASVPVGCACRGRKSVVYRTVVHDTQPGVAGGLDASR